MAIYSIFRKAGAPRDEAVFVKEGFSIAAFVLTFLWALWNRMWVVAAVISGGDGGRCRCRIADRSK